MLRALAFLVMVVLLPLAAFLYAGTAFLQTPNIEWLMDRLYRVVANADL